MLRRLPGDLEVCHSLHTLLIFADGLDAYSVVGDIKHHYHGKVRCRWKGHPTHQCQSICSILNEPALSVVGSGRTKKSKVALANVYSERSSGKDLTHGIVHAPFGLVVRFRTAPVLTPLCHGTATAGKGIHPIHPASESEFAMNRRLARNSSR